MIKNAKDSTVKLMNFIEASPSPFHAGIKIKETLIAKGFKKLDESESWKLQPGKSYFVEKGNSLVAAFRLGLKKPAESGFNMAGSHIDSPGLKIKPASETISKGCAKVSVEIYGGPIVATWLDRELLISGRVMVKDKKGWKQELVSLKKPLAVIPNLAIHLNREINKGFEYNAQNHLPAIISIAENANDKNILKSAIAAELGVKVDAVGEYDLFLSDPNPGSFLGMNDELFISPRLDNLNSTYCILTALCENENPEATAIGIFFDHEEIGSKTPQGADSAFLKNLLERITVVTGGVKDDFHRALSKSFLISADCAHAVHPNFPEKHDSAYSPVLNGGPVIKFNANFRYATTAETAAHFESLCEKAKVPCQKIINRSDMPCGSTIGPISSALLAVRTVDVGNPMWAMHSIRETAGSYDHFYMIKALQEFFI